MQWSLAIALVALFLGCGCEPIRPQTIRVGDSSEQVCEYLDSVAHDISRAVGIQRSSPSSPYDRWYILADNTCLAVRSSRDDSGQERIKRLTLGEKGKGYGDKFKWLAQTHNDVSELTLP